ncbi:ArsR/SmtB family transcription factor [Halomonas garicola]|uniref:ArsR/SmtB family transcription factor n=1 Tax=Halomonas garicola TaxID=1690008 RepID=UPI00289DC685|nr:metalloregulator ArsR/SmtB family transcription factor [Halomonas garicola]
MPDATPIELSRLRESAGEARKLLKTLANTDRLILLCQLSQDEMNVGDLERELGIEQPTLSQQLAVLRREDLVATRREGKQIYYRIKDDRAMAVIETLYEQFCASPGS